MPGYLMQSRGTARTPLPRARRLHLSALIVAFLQYATQPVWALNPDGQPRAMASTFLLSPAVLRFRVRWRGLPPGKTLYPFYRRLGGSQGRSGRGGKSRPHRDSIPNRPARSSVFIPTELPGAQGKWVPGIFSWGKGGRCAGLTTLQTSSGLCLDVWEPEPRETLAACPGCTGVVVPLPFCLLFFIRLQAAVQVFLFWNNKLSRDVPAISRL